MAELEADMEAPDFWNDVERSNEVMKTVKSLKDTLESFNRVVDEYEELGRIKKEIDEKLTDWNDQTIIELLRAFKKEESLKRLVEKDNQLIKLKCLCVLWMDEKIKLSAFGMESTALNEIRSLKDVEKRFLML